MQREINSNTLFETQLNNDLEVFDLRERAANLRNPKLPPILDQQQFLSDYFEKGVKQIADQFTKAVRYNLTGAGKSTFGFSQSQEKPFTRYNSNIFTGADGKLYTAGFSQSDARNDLFNSYDTVSKKDGSFGGVSVRKKSFGDLTREDIKKFFDNSQSQENKGLNQRLQEQFDIVSNRKTFTEEQLAVADSKFIGLTKGIDPKDLSKSVREAAALAYEREAERKIKYDIKAQQLLSSIYDKLNTDGVKVSVIDAPVPIVEIEVKSSDLGASQRRLVSRASQADTERLSRN
jgi:hypothetical protein